jgi:hypothetical protein
MSGLVRRWIATKISYKAYGVESDITLITNREEKRILKVISRNLKGGPR